MRSHTRPVTWPWHNLQCLALPAPAPPSSWFCQAFKRSGGYSLFNLPDRLDEL